MKFIQLMTNTLLEGVVEDVKKRFADKYSSDHIDNIVDKALPDNNKKYLPWVMKHYTQGNIKDSDFSKVKSLLTAFDNHNLQRQKQLSQINGLHELHELAHPYANYSNIQSSNTKTEYEDDNLLIKSHKGHSAVVKAATLNKSNPMYAKTNQPGKAAWCVAVDDISGRDYLNEYTKNQRLKFYTIESKKDNRKYAFIPDKSSTPEFRDEQDSSVDPYSFVYNHPTILSSNLKKPFLEDIFDYSSELNHAYAHIKSIKKPYSELTSDDIKQLYSTRKSADVDKDSLDRLMATHDNTPHEVLSSAILDDTESMQGVTHNKNFNLNKFLDDNRIQDIPHSFFKHALLNDSSVNKVLDKSDAENNNDSEWVGNRILANNNIHDLSSTTIRRIFNKLNFHSSRVHTILNHVNTPTDIVSYVMETHLRGEQNVPDHVWNNPELKNMFIRKIVGFGNVGNYMSNKRMSPEFLHDLIKLTGTLPTASYGKNRRILPETYAHHINKDVEGTFNMFLNNTSSENTQKERDAIFDIIKPHVNESDLANRIVTLSHKVPDKTADFLDNYFKGHNKEDSELVFSKLMRGYYPGNSEKINNVLTDFINNSDNQHGLFRDVLSNRRAKAELLNTFRDKVTPNVINASESLLMKNPNTPEHFFKTILDHGKLENTKGLYSRDYLSNDFMKHAISKHIEQGKIRALTEALNSPSATKEVHLHFLKNNVNSHIFNKGLVALSKIKNLHPSVIQALVTHPETPMHQDVVNNMLKNKNLDEVNLTRLVKNAKGTFGDSKSYELLMNHPSLTKEALDSVIGVTKDSNNFIPEQNRNHALRILHEKLGQMNLPFKGIKK